MKKITIKTAAGEPTTQGFKKIRENSHEIVIQHPNGDFNKVTHGNFSTILEYAQDVETPFKYDADGKKIWYSEPFYLEYTNDFLTVDGIAEHYNITPSMANILIDAGRAENHKK